MEETLQEEAVPCDLIADFDGEIVSMTTRSGVPKMKTGDTCQKGDLLISGIVEILNDSQEVVRTEYVSADADIYVRHQIPYYQEFSLSYQKKIADGKPKNSWYFHIGNWILGAGSASRSSISLPWKKSPGRSPKILPSLFPWEKSPARPTRLKKAVYTKEQAEEKAARQLKLYEKICWISTSPLWTPVFPSP